MIRTASDQTARFTTEDSQLTTFAKNGIKVNRIYIYVNEEKLRNRLEDVLVDLAGQVMIPITSKNRILHMLVLLEQIFSKSQKLQSQANRATQDEKPVLYL